MLSIELRFNDPFDTRQVISEMLFSVNLLVSTRKKILSLESSTKVSDVHSTHGKS